MDASPSRHSQLLLATRANHTFAADSAGVEAQVEPGSSPRWTHPFGYAARLDLSACAFQHPHGWYGGSRVPSAVAAVPVKTSHLRSDSISLSIPAFTLYGGNPRRRR